MECIRKSEYINILEMLCLSIKRSLQVHIHGIWPQAAETVGIMYLTSTTHSSKLLFTASNFVCIEPNCWFLCFAIAAAAVVAAV